MKVILVGGAYDGRRSEIIENVFNLNMPGHDCTDSCISKIEYERHTFKGNSRMFIVFALKGMTDDEIIAKLLLNYKP